MAIRVKAAFSVFALAALIILCNTLASIVNRQIENEKQAKETIGLTNGCAVVLDPGHGGIDTGKRGINGTLEKDINLQLALKIKKRLEEKQIDVVMTRETDKRLGQSQTEDLRTRSEIMNAQNPVLCVSIHQNSYHDADVSGPQVFYYSASDEGEKAAGMIQTELNTLDSGFDKKIKENASYYLLRNTVPPTVIVECGFLSNYGEAEKLADNSYQERIADAVSEGILLYIND